MKKQKSKEDIWNLENQTKEKSKKVITCKSLKFKLVNNTSNIRTNNEEGD